MPHPLGIIGLIANMAGALMLIWFPPDSRGYRRDGSWNGWWHVRATPKGKRQYAFFRRGFLLAVALLFLGFFLQLLDLLRG